MAEAKIRLSVDGASLSKSEIDKVNASLGSLGGGADLAKTTLLSLAGSITAGAFLSYIRGAIDAADAMNDMSQRTGILVKDLAVYELAAKQSGTSMEAISRGVKGLSGVMATNGDALRAAGITATDTNGAMIQLADMFSKMPDGMEKTNLAVKIFGKSGMDLIPMLNMGKVGLQEAADKAAKYAIQMAIMAPLADAFNDNMTEIAINSKVAGMVMMNTALPALNEITRAMADASRTGANFFNIKQPSTGGATGGWSDDGRKGLSDPRIVKPDQTKEIDAITAALIEALKTKGGGADKAEKISEYTRMAEAIGKVTAMQEQELQYGGKLTASQKYQLDEMQKINFALSTKKVNQVESIKLTEMTTIAVAKMVEVEKQAAGIKANQANYADQIEFAKELAEAEVGLSGAREQGRATLMEYATAIDAENRFTQFEITLIGKSETARLKAIELYRIEIDLKKQLAAIDSNAGFDAAQRNEAYAAANAAAAQAKLGVDLKAQKIELSMELKGFDATAAQLESLADTAGKMGDGFKGATAALGGFSNAFKTLSEAKKKEGLSENQRTAMQIGGYGEMAGAAKMFFEEGSNGYEALATVEQAFYIAKFAFQALEIAGNLAVGQSGVASSAMQQAADLLLIPIKVALGIINQANGDPYSAFARIAAMAAVLGVIAAGVGAATGGGGGGSVGTAGAGNQIGSDGRKATNQGEDMNAGTNYNSATGMYDLQNKPQKTEAEMQAMADAAAINAAANAVANLRIEAMKLTKGSEELELSLARASLAAGGMGKAQHELATQGMNEAELASYNYNQALMGQISVQMDIANGTSLTSDNMKTLAAESRSLAIELMMASGDIAGARAMQRDDDTAGYTAQEVAMYDHNQARRDQIDAMNAGASAAREAASEEDNLSQVRYDLAGRVNVLLGRQTQLQVERAAELVGVTDAVALSMLNLVHTLQDLYDTVDRSFAALQRAVTLEKEKANISLAAATGIASALKSAKDSMVNTPDRASAQAQLAMFAAISKAGGGLPSLEALKPVLASLSKSSDNLFGSKADFQRDFFGTARDIAALSGTADAKVSLEQQNIDRLDLILTNAQSQIDVLKGIDTSVISVESAVRNFAAAMTSLTAAQASAATVTATAPTNTAGSVGSYGGGAAAYVDPTAGMNREIVAAYLKYYARNPDQAGHDAFNALGFKGDLLSQTILHASVADKAGADYKTAVSRGYDPNALPTATRATSTASMDDFGSFAVGYNNLPHDAIVQVHKGEDIVPRPYVDLQASSRTETNQLMARLLQSNEALRSEVASLKASVQEGNKSAKTTADALGAGARPLTVKVAA